MEMRLSSKEQEDMVLKNLKLVYYLVNKLSVPPDDYDDLVSIGTVGLIKAVLTFDKCKKLQFATYASKCINNEIFMHFRKEKKHDKVVSLDSIILEDDKGNNDLELIDTIADPDEDFVEKFIENETFERVISIILNLLTTRERLIMLYKIAGFNQHNIAKILNLSQSYISRLEKKLSKKVKACFTNNEQFMEVFKMKILKDYYQISFTSQNVKEFNKIFATFLLNLTSTESLPDFKVSCNENRIIVQVPAHPESFSFIAKLIQQMDDWTIAFRSDKNVPSEDHAASQKVESVASDEICQTGQLSESTNTEQNSVKVLNVINKPETVVSVEEVHTTKSKNNDSAGKKKNMVKQVRDYMLTLDTFSFKDLKKNFPNFTTTTIANALTYAKNKGLISSTCRGEYSVVKTKNTQNSY